MIDHISIRVSDYDRSKLFYSGALAPLGYSLLMESASGAGFHKDLIPDFWIKQGPRGASVHVAFSSSDRATVDAFYRAAMAAGATDNGAPGLRRTTTRPTTARSSWTRTDTTSKLYATNRNERNIGGLKDSK